MPHSFWGRLLASLELLIYLLASYSLALASEAKPPTTIHAPIGKERSIVE